MNGCRICRSRRVAGGQVPPDQDIRLFAELILSDTEESCCKAQRSHVEASDRAYVDPDGTIARPSRERDHDRRQRHVNEFPCKLRLLDDAAVSARGSVALGIHLLLPKNEPPVETRSYATFCSGFCRQSPLPSPSFSAFRPGLRDVDAAHVPNFCGRHFAAVPSGKLSRSGFRLLAAAVFPQSGRRPAKFDQRSRASFRQHLALARFASHRICARRYRRPDHRSLHRLVSAGALLGNAGA